MASLITTAQNWPLVPNPSSKPTVSDAVEKAAAKSPRMSIDVELDFDDPGPLPPVVISFDPPPKIVAPPPPVPVAARRAPADGAEPKSAPTSERPRPVETSLLFSSQPIAELAPPVEPRRRVPIGVSLLCLLSVAGSIAIVALKLLP